MGMKPHRFVGLNRDVWLPDDITVIIDIVPSWRTNIRSNQPATEQHQTRWHDTGNPSSNALGERNWLHSGASGSYVGYNFAYDATRIIQLTPLNEVTWAAGTASGNRYAWHMEQTLNTDWEGSLHVGAALHGGLCAAMGWDVATALKQHNYDYGKNCPAQIRKRGLWPTVVQKTQDAAARANAASGGVVVAEPTYTYAQPIKVDGKAWDGLADVTVNDRLHHGQVQQVTVAVETLNRRVGPLTKDVLSGPALPKGETFSVLGWVEGDEVGGENRWWVTPWGSHIWVGGTTEQPIEKPVFDPDTVRIIRGDKVYYPAGADGKGREVVVAEEADLRRWAATGSPVVGSVKREQVVKAFYWCKGDEVDDEYVWWLLEAESSDPIDNAPRLHAAYTYQRPV